MKLRLGASVPPSLGRSIVSADNIPRRHTHFLSSLASSSLHHLPLPTNRLDKRPYALGEKAILPGTSQQETTQQWPNSVSRTRAHDKRIKPDTLPGSLYPPSGQAVSLSFPPVPAFVPVKDDSSDSDIAPRAPVAAGQPPTMSGRREWEDSESTTRDGLNSLLHHWRLSHYSI